MHDVTETVAKFRANPVLYVRKLFNAEPQDWQLPVLEAYGRGDRQIAVKSCHGPGKTCLLAWMAIHHIHTKYDSKCMVTAPSSTQLKDALMPEIKKWIGVMPPELAQQFDMQSERILSLLSPQTNFISARTSRAEQPDALAGVHAENVLLIGDEASGIPDQVFEFSGGSMSSEKAQLVLAGNPVRSVGYFADVFGKLKHAWTTFTVSHTDSDRVSDAWVDEMRMRYGEDSNIFRVRCLGEFPLGDDDTVIPWELIVGAMERDVVPNPDAAEVWGVDVARYGDDDSALAKRKANILVEPVKVWRNLDTMELTGRVKAEYDAANPKPAQINVDAIGLGAGVADRLREMGVPALAVNVSESPSMKERYRNLRAELWYECREWFEHRDCQLQGDHELAEELAMPRYKMLSSGKLQIEAKEDMKKRGKQSPNRGDAFVLTFANAAGTAIHGYRPSNWNTPIQTGFKRLA